MVDIKPAADPFAEVAVSGPPEPPTVIAPVTMPGPVQKPAAKPATAPVVAPPMPEPIPMPTMADGELMPDGPNDDRVDLSLKARAQTYSDAEALDWLLQQQQQQAPAGGKPGAPQAAPQAPAPTPDAAKPVGQRGPHGVPTPPATPISQSIGNVTDVAYQGLVGGPRDAIQAVVDTVNWLDEHIPLGGITLTDDEGNATLPTYRSAEEMKVRNKKNDGVPEVRAPKTAAAGLARAITSFMVPFTGAAKAIGGLKSATALGRVGRATSAGFLADFLASTNSDENLANIIQEYAPLTKPITEYLSTDKDDGFWEKRLKTAVIGAGLGPMADGFVYALKAVKYAKQFVHSGTGSAEENTLALARGMTEDQMAREAGQMPLLGNEAIPEAVVVKPAEDKMAPGIKGLEGIPGQDLARSMTPKGLRPIAGNDEVYINFARINTPEDIWKVINDTAAAFKGDITKATRGVRTHKQTVEAADDIEAFDLLMKRNPGSPLNAEQTVAARRLHATTASAVFDAARLAHTQGTPENYFQLRRLMSVHAAVQKELIGARSETARALNAWAIPVGGGGADKLKGITEQLAYGGGDNVTAQMAARIASIEGKPGAATVIAKLSEKGYAAKTVGLFQEYWINALLSGPKTHIVNMMSNSTVAGISIAERAVAARFGRLFQDEGVEVGEAMAMIQSLRGGIYDGFRNAGKALYTGKSGYALASGRLEMGRERFMSSGTWGLRTNSWVGRGIDGLGTVVNMPGKMLQAEDEFFKTVGYRMELWAQAQRTVAQELKSGSLKPAESGKRFAEILDNPPEAIRLEAAANAAYQTFTESPGRISKAVIRFSSEFPVMKWIIPFVNTPGNIMKYAFVEHTPLAMVSKKYRNAITKGGADADLARTKMAMGTMALMLAIDMGLNGHLTGSGPASPGERNTWRRNNQPFSVRIGDKQLAYNRMDPLGSTLGYGAMLAEYLMNMDESEASFAEFNEMFAMAAFGAAETATSKSYLTGFSSFVNAIDDPKRHGEHFLNRFASSFVPTGVGEVARFLDPVQRQTNDAMTAALAKIPGMSQDLPAKRDFWGKPISYQSGYGRIYDAVSPIYGHTYKPEPADLAMEADGFFPGMPTKGMQIQKVRISFANRPDIYSRYLELRGTTKASELSDKLADKYGDKTMLETLNDMVTGKNEYSDIWKLHEGNPEARERDYRKIIEDYQEGAKNQVLEEFPWITDKAEEIRTSKGLIPMDDEAE
jgi:hypothetical protein